MTVPRTHLLAGAVAFCLSASSNAVASLIEFDNSALTWRWFTGGLDNYFLDITTDVAHQPVSGDMVRPHSMIQDPRPSSGNLTPGQTSLGGQAASSFALGALFDRGPAGSLQGPAQLGVGDVVGPSLTYGQVVYVGSVRSNFGQGEPPSQVLSTTGYIGVRLQLADGTHYGWVHVIGTLSGRAWNFDADRWAYESIPDAPAIIPSPSVLAVLGIGSFAASRRRR